MLGLPGRVRLEYGVEYDEKLRMQAVRATFFGLPASKSRW